MSKENAVCAGTIVFRINENNKIEFMLVMPKQGNGKSWGIPKGHKEKGESIEETAVRETWEETGVVARLLYELPPVFATTPKESKSVHCFIAKQLNEGRPKPCPQEIAEIKWFPIDNLPNVHSYQKPLVKNAIKAINKNLL